MIESDATDYTWNNPTTLVDVLNDAYQAEAWADTCKAAREAMELGIPSVFPASETASVFLQRRDRVLMEKVARQLLGKGLRREVLNVLQRRLEDVLYFSKGTSSGEDDADPEVRIVRKRACDVSRWILNVRMKELARLQIDPIDLSQQVTTLLADHREEQARRKVRIAVDMLRECLPVSLEARKRNRPARIALCSVFANTCRVSATSGTLLPSSSNRCACSSSCPFSTDAELCRGFAS